MKLSGISQIFASTVLCGIATMVCQGGTQISLDGTWRHWVDTENYEPITVPFSLKPGHALKAYQKIFTVPADMPSELAILHFDGVAGWAAVYLNGVKLGEHGSYTPFRFHVSELLNRDGDNDLIVTIDDRRDGSTIPYEDIPWVHYSGLIRSVYLEYAANATVVSIEPQYEFRDGLSQVEGTVRVELAGRPGVTVSLLGAVLNGSPDAWTIAGWLDPGQARCVDGTGSATMSFSIDQPRLWSPQSPQLYSLFIAAMVDGELEDLRLIQVGFRDVRVEGNKILLNGSPLLLKGLSRHDIYPGTGYVGTEQQMVEDMVRIKQSGVNYVRLAHYPHNPRILCLADQLGLLVSGEVPAWANFLDPNVRGKLYGMLEEMIRRDMYHPSVFLWITGNARAYPMPYALEASRLARSLDRNRLVSYVIDNDEYDRETIAADVAFVHEAELDLYMKISWWFYYVEYLQDAWANFPKDIPLVIAEFGREGNSREPIVVDGEDLFWWKEDQQAEALSEMLEAWRPHLPQYNNEEHVSGLILFNYQDIDWPDISRYLPNHIPRVCHGVVYGDRTEKLALSTLRNFYATLPTEFVGLPTPDDAGVETLFTSPTNLDSSVNGAYRDSGPSVVVDGRKMYFASDGPDHVGLPRIYITENIDGLWTPPALVDMPQEAEPFAFRRSPCISYDGKTLYFTRALVNGIYVACTRIWQSRFVEGRWADPEDLGDVVNYPDAARITSDPSVTADGRILYFASDRPGGMGHTDIWVTWRVDGPWAEPMNLGPDVNSPYSDGEPCISPDGRTLYFSSNRPAGMGSTDIWVTHFVDGRWTEPKNLGPEVNSPGADREPEVSKDGRVLYFTGIRSGGEGLSDLWIAQSVDGPR